MFGLFGGRRKRERESVEQLLSQVPKGAFGLLVMVTAAHKMQRPDEANGKVQKYPTETESLLMALAVPRDSVFSSGPTMDQVNLDVWHRNLAELGYSVPAARIVAYVYHHHLEDPLLEIAAKQMPLWLKGLKSG